MEIKKYAPLTQTLCLLLSLSHTDTPTHTHIKGGQNDIKWKTHKWTLQSDHDPTDGRAETWPKTHDLCKMLYSRWLLQNITKIEITVADHKLQATQLNYSKHENLLYFANDL